MTVSSLYPRKAVEVGCVCPVVPPDGAHLEKLEAFLV